MRPRLLVIGTLAGALVLFAWQATSHELFHLPERGFRAFPNDRSGSPAHVIRALAPDNGMYYSARGIFAAVDISPSYTDKTSRFASMLSKQFALNVAVAFALVLVVERIGEESMLGTAGTYALLALTLQGMIDVSNAIWYNFSWTWTLANMLDQVIAFFLVGLTIAALRRRYGEPKTKTAERPALPTTPERFLVGR
jgi:hypothetical protein